MGEGEGERRGGEEVMEEVVVFRAAGARLADSLETIGKK